MGGLRHFPNGPVWTNIAGMLQSVDTIVKMFRERGSGQYGNEEVTQLQHALQCATLAEAEGASVSLIAAALLHDIGHIFEKTVESNDGLDRDLDDAHEYRAYAWLKEHFGCQVADPVRLHVQAKRYLCTIDPDYVEALSPTSHKSYLDQGGPMSAVERAAFETEPNHHEALRLRRWDDQAKDPRAQVPRLEHFVPYLERVLASRE